MPPFPPAELKFQATDFSRIHPAFRFPLSAFGFCIHVLPARFARKRELVPGQTLTCITHRFYRRVVVTISISFI